MLPECLSPGHWVFLVGYHRLPAGSSILGEKRKNASKMRTKCATFVIIYYFKEFEPLINTNGH
jgi:hypothetical protein